MLQEVEHCTIPSLRNCEVYTGPTDPPQRHMVEITLLNSVQGYRPREDSKFEFHKSWRNADDERPVVQREEQEGTEQAEEYYR